MMDNRQYKLVKLLEQASQEPTKQENGDIYCWLSFCQLHDLVEIVGEGYFCEGGVDVNLQGDCVCMVINDLLEYMGIEESVFEVQE